MFAIHRACHFVHLITVLRASYAIHLLWSAFTETQISLPSVSFQKRPSTFLFLPTLLSPIVQSASFPNHPVSLLAITHELLEVYTPIFSHQTKQMC